jgi:hypothetical protein
MGHFPHLDMEAETAAQSMLDWIDREILNRSS